MLIFQKPAGGVGGKESVIIDEEEKFDYAIQLVKTNKASQKAW